MKKATYQTRADAIQREIVEPIESSRIAKAEEYDVEAIADRTLGGYSEGFACLVDFEEFWEIVQQHELP